MAHPYSTRAYVSQAMLHFQAEAATIDGPESSAAAMTSRAAEASLGEQAVHQKGFLAKRTTPLKVWK
ncbi:hypothetical protein H4R35_007200, partial [Dimargaris xerosporica]